MKKNRKEKQKKEKIIYIDDNSTVADMSNTRREKKGQKKQSTFREKARTYFTVVKKNDFSDACHSSCAHHCLSGRACGCGEIVKNYNLMYRVRLKVGLFV